MPRSGANSISRARAFIRFLGEKIPETESGGSPNSLVALAVRPALFNASPANYSPIAAQIFRIVELWPPAYMPFASPIIGGLVIGPGAIFLRAAIERDGPEADMLRLCLSQVARFWEIGSVFLGRLIPLFCVCRLVTVFRDCRSCDWLVRPPRLADIA